MVYIFLAEGFEEIEALTQIDLLRRADIEVTAVGVNGKFCSGAHGINVECDMDIADYDGSDAEMIILPGGMPGVTNLYSSDKVLDAVKSAEEKGIIIAAICAAPLILGRLGYSTGKEMICYPGFEDELNGAVISGKSVVTSGNFITAKAAGSAFGFAYEIIKSLKGAKQAQQVIDSIYYER